MHTAPSAKKIQKRAKMEFFTILISAIKESLASNLYLETLGAITLVSSVLYLLYFFGLKLKTKLINKKQNSYEHQTGLSIPEKQHLEELKAIKSKMASGSNEPIRIDAVKALYIAQNWDEYNLVASEDSKIMFEKMKSFEDVVDVSVSPTRNSLPSSLEPRAALRTEYLGGTEFKIYSDVGYTHYKDGLMVESKLFADINKNQKGKNKKFTTLEEKEEQVQKAQKALEEDEPEVAQSKPKFTPAKTTEPKPEQPISQPEASPKSEQKDLDAFLASLQKNKKIEPEIQKTAEPKVEQPDAASPTLGEPSPNVHSVEPVVAKNSEAPLPATPPLPSTSQTPVDKSGWLKEVISDAVPKEDIFVDDTPLLDPKAMADLVAGKKPSAPKPSAPKLEYHMLYSFDGFKSFFGSNFLSEPNKTYQEKLADFISFLSKHPFVYFVNGNQTMIVHVDSFVLALARTVMEENRDAFLNAIYDNDSILTLQSLCGALDMFSSKINLAWDSTFFQAWAPSQLSYRSYVFPRAIKTQGKITKGEFILLNFKDALKVLLGKINFDEFGELEVIATSTAEMEKISGKRLKLKTKEEILNVL